MVPPAPASKPVLKFRAEWWLLLAVLVSSGFRVFFYYRTHVLFDDALISLRYAENLVGGRGLVYNPGERVFGASTPLYVLLLALLSSLHLPALICARGLSILADGAALFLWGRYLWRQTGSFIAPLAFALFFGLSPNIVEVTVSGMETSFALLLLTWALLADLEDRPDACGVALGLLVLVRPDGLLAAAIILLLRWRRTRALPWRPAAIAAAITLPWVVFATLYFGSPVPNSIPAKLAAYNLHRKDQWYNPRGTLGMVAPLIGPYARQAFTLMLLPCWVMGLVAAWRSERWRTIAVLFLTWWVYLAVPRTVLFTWYYPPLLLPAYFLAAVGADAWNRRPGWRPSWTVSVLGAAAVALVLYISFFIRQTRMIHGEEIRVRLAGALWLRDHTPKGALIALEPLGYMGYYSGRRVLDEVGLVSPEMIPLNRAGDGWFAEMLRRYRPEYVVERPSYMARNETILSKVRLFNTDAERLTFAAEYEPVAHFESSPQLKGRLWRDYRFVIYRRRTDAEAAAERAILERLDPPARAARELQSMTAGVALRSPAEEPAVPGSR